MNDRDCDNCAHHSDGGCSVWECSFEQKDDTISRQTAIDAIRREYNKEDSDLPTDYQLGLSAARKIIEQLPSAQPNLQPTCNNLATDAISRQAAVDAVNDITKWYYKNYHETRPTTIAVIDALKQLPSAQSDISEKLYLCKCYVTDEEGLQHEVIHTGDIRRITGWEI